MRMAGKRSLKGFKLLVSRTESVPNPFSQDLVSLVSFFLSSRRNESIDRASWKLFSSKHAHQNYFATQDFGQSVRQGL